MQYADTHPIHRSFSHRPEARADSPNELRNSFRPPEGKKITIFHTALTNRTHCSVSEKRREIRSQLRKSEARERGTDGRSVGPYKTRKGEREIGGERKTENEGHRMASAKMGGPSAPAIRRDPYEVLSVSRDSSDQEIKTAYRKLALKHTDFTAGLLIKSLISVSVEHVLILDRNRVIEDFTAKGFITG
ncbi:hypothetical protein ACLOJK_033029 [Asimina triloba]